MSRLDDTLALVSIASVSRSEAALATHIEKLLVTNSALEVTRIADNVIARTTGSLPERVLIAGHIDTVPGEASEAKIVGDVLHGVGSCDMKGSVAVMLELAMSSKPRSTEITWVFYAKEEIARSESGLHEVLTANPQLLKADVAILGEPSDGGVEAGCQGSLRIEIQLKGARAHTARPFTGRNAVHRAGEVISKIAAYTPREVTIDGATYVEQMQVVAVNGGISPNVVPDAASLTVNHRFAPDKNADEALESIKQLLGSSIEEGDAIQIIDSAPSAAPSLKNSRLKSLVSLTGVPVRGKLGWTDVATFAELGIPATNFGAGDPLLAHRSDEFVTLNEIDEYARVLDQWLSN
ncbi:MAG: succinyl-diaminopimelate desuccinylase [Acidimicrobiaceae bacterium]